MSLSDNNEALLAAAITSIKTSHFTSSLIALLQHTVNFDFAVMLGYRDGKRPVYLFDSINEQRNLLFECYLTQAFENDPFFSVVDHHRCEGVFHISDIRCDNVSLSEYQQAFYKKTNWQDEICMTIQISDRSWVLLFLGSTTPKTFTPKVKTHLVQRFQVVRALCRQHWEATTFSLPQDSPDCQSTIAAVHRSLATFGQSLLSEREQQITALLLQGFDTQDIASQFGITPGTVKNHRKKIYKKLCISSMSELFQLFLQHLITQPRQT